MSARAKGVAMVAAAAGDHGQQTDDAIKYLHGVGSRSSLAKIRKALDALAPVCAERTEQDERIGWQRYAEAKYAPTATLTEVYEALDAADDFCNEDSGADAEERADYRETLISAAEALVDILEEPEVTPDVTAGPATSGPARPVVTPDVTEAVVTPDVTEAEHTHVWTCSECGATADRVTPDVTARLCQCGCGERVTSLRPEAAYAKPACRVRAHRRRNGGRR